MVVFALNTGSPDSSELDYGDGCGSRAPGRAGSLHVDLLRERPREAKAAAGATREAHEASSRAHYYGGVAARTAAVDIS